MSKELLSPGNDFLVEQYDRGFGSKHKEVFKISGDDGTVTLNGVALTGDQTIAGALQTTGNAAVGGNLAVTGTSAFTGAVTLPANTVAAAKLAAAVRTAIPGTPTIALGTLTANHVDATIQLKDVAGTALAAPARAFCWLSATAGATAVGTSTTGLTTTVTTGYIAAVVLANLAFECISDSSGVIVVRVDDSNGTETRYLNVAIGNQVVSSAAITTT